MTLQAQKHCVVALFLLGALCGCSTQQAPAQAQTQQFDAPQSGAGSSSQNSSDPRNRAKIHTELGSMYFQAGNQAVALEELGTAIEADSGYFQAYSVRGLVRAALKENGKAEDDFRRALSLAPNDPEVNNNYGWFLCDIGKEKESISYFMNAVRNPLYQTPDRAYTNAGTCSMKAGNLDSAQKYLLKALELSRDGAINTRLQLATLFYKRGNFEEARVYLNDVVRKMDQPTAEALWLGIRIEHKLGDRMAEGGYASRLRGRYPTSQEYQEFLKGNFE